MSARSPSREQRDPCRFFSALSSAFAEWLLIIFLVIDAFCLYMVTKLSHSCELQTPCLMCSRLGQFFGHEKLAFYKDLTCDAHKIEISSLAFCHVHKKLVDVREMCETCFLSFVKKKSSLEACKFLLSKIGLDLDQVGQITNSGSEDMAKAPLLRNDYEAYSLFSKVCSCCSRPLRNKPYAYRFFQNKPVWKGLRPRARLPYGIIRPRESSLMPLTIYQPREYGFDRLPDFGYRELKIASESESEVPFTDDDDAGSTHAHRPADVKEESGSPCLKSNSSVTTARENIPVISDDMVLEKLIHLNPLIPDASSSVSNKGQAFEASSFNEPFADPNVGFGHGLEEINWSHVEMKQKSPALSQDIPKPVTPEAANVNEQSEFTNVSKKLSTFEVNKALTITDTNCKAEVLITDSNPSSEVALSRESAKLHEDLRHRLSQLPAARWLESISIDINLNSVTDESKLADTPTFSRYQNYVKRAENELVGVELVDGISVNEVEGEAMLDRLKRQIETDHKSLSILYKELEEERNASAVAANEAMAMINKLQEEKASMQMEALQYLRMMEEQAEYDQEALQKLNGQLVDREKEILDLESELESYRKRFRDDPLAGNFQPPYDSDESEYSTTSTPHVSKTRVRGKTHMTNITFQDFAGGIKENVLDFEDEREYISECLKRLEKNVRLFSSTNLCQHEDADGDEENCVAGVTGQNEKITSPNKGNKINRVNSFFSSSLQLKDGTRNDMVSIGDEISHLNARLEALEADRNFLEHTINSLRNGRDGLEFVQEIATYLRDLRKFGLTNRDDVFD